MPSIAAEIEGLQAAWAQAGLPREPLDFLVPLTERLQELEFGSDPASGGINLRRIAEGIVEGKTTFAEGMTAFAEASAAGEAVSVTNRATKRRVLLDAVAAGIRGAVRAGLQARAGELLGHLQQAHDSVISEAAKSAPLVEGIADDGAALRAGEKTAKAWRTLTVASAQREHLLAALRALVTLGGLTYPRASEPTDRTFRHPDRAPRIRIDTHPARRLTVLLESGAEPAIVSPGEVAARLADEAAAARREHQPTPEPAASH